MSSPVGAVVSDHETTSDVGRNILKLGGSAVDAAIAMVICNGVCTFQSMGIGGGMFMVIHQKGCQDSVYIDGNCTAPSRIKEMAYKENKGQNGYVWKICIPGTIKACKVAHDMYGRLPWTDLFQPAIRMLRKGFPISKSAENAFYLCDKYPENILMDNNISKELRSIFRSNDKQLRMGDIITLPNLADTLEGIAEQGPDYLYYSHVTKAIVKELQQQGGIQTVEDFQKYKVLHGKTFALHFGDYILHTAYGATGGVILALALNILKGYNFTASDYAKLSDTTEVYHKMLEVFRFVLPFKDKMGDADFHDIDWIFNKATCDNFAAFIRSKIDGNKTHEQQYYTDELAKTVEDRGTSHISVLSPDGDSVSCTSSIRTYFGSAFISRSTGIIWNDIIDNFDKDDSGTTINRVEPGKRPRSAMTPAIITDKQGNTVLAIGAAGSTRIITTLVQVIAKLLWFKLPLPKAVEDRRLHYDTDENCILVEDGFSELLYCMNYEYYWWRKTPDAFYILDQVQIGNLVEGPTFCKPAGRLSYKEIININVIPFKC